MAPINPPVPFLYAHPDPAPPGKKKKDKSGGPLSLGSTGTYQGGTKATGERGYFNAFMKAHPVMQRWATLIWNAADRYGGITATQLAAVIFAESGGNKDIRSGAGALGLGQIYDNAANSVNAAGVPFFRPGSLAISEADKTNPEFAINYAAWRLSGYATVNGGTIDDIWMGGYNPNYRNTPGYNKHFVSQYLPKGYMGTGGSTAVDTAGKSTDTSTIANSLRDPFVVGVKNVGSAAHPKWKVQTTYSTTIPKNAIMFDGQPVTLSVWDSTTRQLEPFFVSYTGGRPNAKVVESFMKKGWSTYTLTSALSQTKAFFTSPIFKKMAPAFQDAVKGLLGPGESLNAIRTKPTTKNSKGDLLIRQAIVNGWDATTLATMLRERPEYLQSTEFKGNTATLETIHASIMGNPDANGMRAIQQATLAGWSPDQYAAWLRSQPSYTQSPEFQTKTMSFLDALGLITGQQTTLKPGQATPASNPNPSGFGPLPTDPRLKPAAPLASPEDTVAGLG